MICRTLDILLVLASGFSLDVSPFNLRKWLVSLKFSFDIKGEDMLPLLHLCNRPGAYSLAGSLRFHTHAIGSS